ncbi:LytR C-terminal domain-containing protein [Massilia sp. BJB1822]|uniref:LytR C-terminal domain-containing protein n=1 Tax=Massilia sp. BJB1822 TaxID=2744470 RepID=UPI001594499E|nr:LytR C-terminal domain-containing protein [Massilia sp. BJB1822]NVD97144.1 LytR C-terminal domain-containing protein [Massilia sp. BJB1822]
MNKLKPIAFAIAGCGLIGACSTPPARQELTMQPVLRIDSGTRAGNQIGTWNRLGRYHQERGQLSLALGAYAQSLALDPRQLEARSALAAIEARQGRLEAAREQLQALAADYPAEAQPHTNLGYVQYLMGDYAGAIGTLRKAMALGAGPKAYENLQLAETAARENGLPEAAALAAAIKTQPGAISPALAVASLASAAEAYAAAPATESSAPPLSEASATPDAGQLHRTSRMELVELKPNVYELKLRPVVTALPMVAAVAAKAPAPGTAAGTAARRARIEVANGNGATGMARRVRELLVLSGIPVDRLSNDKPYRQQITTIQYGPDYASQAAELKSALQGKAVLEASDKLQAVDLRLVLGKDAQATLAAAGQTADAALMASTGGSD